MPFRILKSLLGASLLLAMVSCGQNSGAVYIPDSTSSETQALREQNELLRQQLAEEQRRADEQRSADQKAAMCEQHYRSLGALEERFSTVSATHGMFLNNMKSCFGSTDQGSCIATVCIGAALFSNGEANCVEVAAQSDQIHSALLTARQSASYDGCTLPDSPTMNFYDY